jgi:hypothetical protein
MGHKVKTKFLAIAFETFFFEVRIDFRVSP